MFWAEGAKLVSWAQPGAPLIEAAGQTGPCVYLYRLLRVAALVQGAVAPNLTFGGGPHRPRTCNDCRFVVTCTRVPPLRGRPAASSWVGGCPATTINHLPPSRYYPLVRRRPNEDLVDEVLDVVPAGPAGLATPVVTRPMPRPQPKIKAHIKDIKTLFPEGAMCLFAGPWGSVGPRAVVGKEPAAAE